MDPSDYARALRKSWVVIIVLGIVGALVGFGVAHGKADSYRSTSSVFVTTGSGTTTDQLVQGSTFSQQQVASYVQLATTPSVLTPVIDQLGLSTTPTKLARQISASTPLNTVVVDIAVTDSSARRSAEIANAVASSLRTVAGDLAPQSKNGQSLVTLSVVAPAQVPANPIGPNRRLIEIIGAVAGLAVGVLFAVFRTLLDTRLITARDVELQSHAALLGAVEKSPSSHAGTLALLDTHDTAEAEDYRRIATTLQFAGPGQSAPTSLAVVSAGHGDGRTRVTLNTALAIAERSQQVLVIDGDLRGGHIAQVAQLKNDVGLSEVLSGSSALDAAVQAWQPGVDVLTSGSLPSNPSAAIRGEKLAAILSDIVSDYDLVIIDTPALDVYSDALPLAELTAGTVVVGRSKATKRAALDRTLDALSGIRASVVGVVLTQVRSNRPRLQRHAAPQAPAAAPAAEPAAASSRD